MLGLSSSCDATVRLTRKASIPEKPGDVKEFVSLSGNCFRSDMPAARCVPLAHCGLFVITRRCLFIPCNALCHCEASFCGAVAISRKGLLVKAMCLWRDVAYAAMLPSARCVPLAHCAEGLALFPFFDIYCFYFGGVILLDSLFLMLRNLLIFSSYVENKNSFPKPLSREKEAEYVLRAENGDKEATELLIRHNLRLVAHIAKNTAITRTPTNLFQSAVSDLSRR